MVSLVSDVIQVNPTNYDGKAIRIVVVANTDFNEPVYKEILITDTNGCNSQSVSVKDTAPLVINLPII